MIINEIKITKGKQHVSFNVEKCREYKPSVSFCENGYHSTVVGLPLDQYDMLKKLLNKAEIIEFYEELRNETNKPIYQIKK